MTIVFSRILLFFLFYSMVFIPYINNTKKESTGNPMNRIKKCLKYVSQYFSAYSHPDMPSPQKSIKGFVSWYYYLCDYCIFSNFPA